MEKKAVGIWIRVSTEDQARGESPEHHEQRARYYAESRDWEVKVVYHLEAVSGKSVMEHPETKKMLHDIKHGRISGIIFSKLARLARNTKELLDFADIFRGCNADLISLQEAIDTSSPAGRLFYTMIAAMAQWEREEIASRVAASVPVRAKLGKPLGGQGSFGYRWTGKELIVDEKEAPIRKQIYELFLKHKRKGAVAKTLNELGYRTRNGSQFTDTTIGRLLRDPMAKGERRSNYTKSLGDKKNWELKPESEWVIMPCPQIVSAELWDECNRILDEQEKTNKRPVKRAAYLFTGFIFCHCGAKMYVPSASKKYRCFTCGNNSIGIDDAEFVYYSHLQKFLLTDNHIGEFLEKTSSNIQKKEDELNNLTAEAKGVREERNNIVSLFNKKQIPEDGFKDYYDPLDTQLKQLEAAMPELQGELDYLKIEQLNGNHLLHEAKDLYKKWPVMDDENKRVVVEQITKKVTIGREDVSILFRYNPNPKPTLSLNDPDSQRNFKGSCLLST